MRLLLALLVCGVAAACGGSSPTRPDSVPRSGSITFVYQRPPDVTCTADGTLRCSDSETQVFVMVGQDSSSGLYIWHDLGVRMTRRNDDSYAATLTTTEGAKVATVFDSFADPVLPGLGIAGRGLSANGARLTDCISSPTHFVFTAPSGIEVRPCGK